MGLGCMGMSEFYGPSDEAQSRDLLHYAIERGERFFDTADIYGFGHNEVLVGRVLRDHPLRHDIVLATKYGDEHGGKSPYVPWAVMVFGTTDTGDS